LNDESKPVTGQQLFPHMAYGAGYSTQFVLFGSGAGSATGGTLVFTGQDGASLSTILTPQ
jgi:hypothetical protein